MEKMHKNEIDLNLDLFVEIPMYKDNVYQSELYYNYKLEKIDKKELLAIIKNVLMK